MAWLKCVGMIEYLRIFTCDKNPSYSTLKRF